MKKLYFVRHGESVANLKHLFAGRWDTPLTPLGRDQANLAGSQASELNITHIVSSPLSRSRETAEIIADRIGYPKDKIIISELFIERSYGDLQQQPYSAADGIDFEEVANIETIPQLIERGAKAAVFLSELGAGNVLVSSHGTFGRVLRDAVLGQAHGDIEVPIDQEIPNATIIEWL
jgi:uncharacterized phosphatase